jgi:uncharacterized protein YdaU (DUF1376 family)
VNFYKRFIGDIQRDTGHLSCAEMGVYDRLLDHYYATEQALPADVDACCRIARAMNKDERKAVDSVLRQYFTLEDVGYIQDRAQRELLDAQPKINAAKTNGKKGGRPRKNPEDTKQETQEKPSGLSELTQLKSSPEPEPEKPSVLDTPSDIPAPTVVGVTGGDKPIGTPAGHLAAELIKAGVKVTAQHPTLLAWLNDGYTREDVMAALEVARITKPLPAALPAGYLDAVVRAPKPAARPKQPGQSTAVTPWFMSVAGIEAKAKELNIQQQRDEQFPYFKERVYKAAKVTQDMLRAAQVDGARA